MRDLFGNEVTEDQARALLAKARKKRKEPVPRGYAAQPGTGPAGETCRSCRHYVRKHLAKAYLKCALMRAHWTGGGSTDIRAGSPACKRWEKPAG